jgi:C-terminal processing protease CtpA/Prc
MKNLKRATIVGETTGGGAHPGGGFRVAEHFGMFVPTGRAISPITKTNWEGTGVEPDVKVPADQALKVAHLAALRKSLEKTTDKELKGALEDLIESMQKEVSEAKEKK